MKRRYFLAQFILGILAFACSKGTSTPYNQSVTPDACANQNPNTMIAENHGHSVTISIGDVLSETGGSYNLSTGDNHTHTLILSTSDMQTLKANLTLTDTTSFDAGHSHSVTITCIG